MPLGGAIAETRDMEPIDLTLLFVFIDFFIASRCFCSNDIGFGLVPPLGLLCAFAGVIPVVGLARFAGVLAPGLAFGLLGRRVKAEDDADFDFASALRRVVESSHDVSAPSWLLRNGQEEDLG